MPMSNTDEDVLIKCESVSKKFCRDFKRSLWYGIKDVSLSFSNKGNHNNALRKDEFWAVKDINFELKRGECLGLIGHNGAGKSTLLKILNGLLTPDIGQVTMRGKVGALIELGAGFNPILTGRENVYNNAAVLGFTKEEIDAKYDAIVAFSEIGEFIESPVQNYSSGMKVRLGFAIAAEMEPDILLIDEVLAVGDLGFIIKCLNRISELMTKTATIFVSHSMPMVARVSTQVLLMHKGAEQFLGGDTAQGIKEYVDLFDSPERINQGTGEIELAQVGIYNSGLDSFVSDHSALLETGDDLKLRFTLDVKDHISDFNLGITMFDAQLREALSSSSTFKGKTFSRTGKEQQHFEITLPHIILTSGKYAVTLVASNPTTGMFYMRVTNCTYFSMKAIGISWGTSVVAGEWTELSTF
ncbi:MAG: lipopolysaccharide transport system ATP-binding protein [Sediminicola sp.]|jgi:lipopolysaccharide transport system ATP-binding protein